MNGRNNILWSEKLKLDVWYVDNCSLQLDLRILLITITAVLKRSGINKEGCETTVPFNGAN